MSRKTGRLFGWRLMSIAGGVCLASQASAGNVTSASIIRVYAYNGNVTPTYFFVALSQNDTNIGCNSGNLPLFVIDISTLGGRAQAATILSAQASGQTVSIIGTGSCNLASTAESAAIVSIP